MATTTELLADAEAKYHALMTGRSVVELRDQNGETVKYSQAGKNALKAYIEDLKSQIAAGLSGATPTTGPMRVWM